MDPSSGRQRPFRARLQESGAFYLTALFVTPAVAQFTQYLFPGRSIFGAQPVSVIFALLGTCTALALWFPYRSRLPWPFLFHVFMGASLVTWVSVVIIANFHRDLFNLTALLVPPILLMIWLKRPESRDVWRAGDALAWSLIAIAVAAQLLDWMGLRELRYDFWNRLPVIDQIIGPIGRWEGPFGNSNLAGPIGAFLVAYGLFRYGFSRWVMVITGGVVVFLSDSRTGYLGLVAALLVAAVYQQHIGPLRMTRTIRIAMTAILVLTVLMSIVVLDPTLNGRTDLWALFFELWWASPLAGVGEVGISEATRETFLDGWGTHGHNILMDPLARSGIVGMGALIVALVSALALTIRAAQKGSQVGLALLVCFLTVGISEDVVDWRYLGVQALPLVVAVVLGVVAGKQCRAETRYCDAYGDGGKSGESSSNSTSASCRR